MPDTRDSVMDLVQVGWAFVYPDGGTSRIHEMHEEPPAGLDDVPRAAVWIRLADWPDHPSQNASCTDRK